MGDGTTDDTKAILAAIIAGCDNVPAGDYYCPGLVLPVNSVLKGDGDAWLKGDVKFGSGARLSGLKIGRDNFASLFSGISDVGCDHVTFVGGGGLFRYPAYHSHPITIQDCDDMLFDVCSLARNSGVDASANKDAHFNTAFILSSAVAGARRTHDILWHRCHFGIANAAGLVGSPRFHVEIWEDYTIANRVLGFKAIDFEWCEFEAPESSPIDYAGCATSADPSVPASGFSHVTDCTFKGNGVGAWRWCADVQSEQGTGYITLSRNHCAGGHGPAFLLMGPEDARGPSGGHYIVTDNILDATLPGSVRPDGPWVGFLTVNGPGCTVTGNRVTCPSRDPRWPGSPMTGILANVDGSTVTGNTVRGGLLTVTGSNNVTSPNTVI